MKTFRLSDLPRSKQHQLNYLELIFIQKFTLFKLVSYLTNFMGDHLWLEPRSTYLESKTFLANHKYCFVSLTTKSVSITCFHRCSRKYPSRHIDDIKQRLMHEYRLQKRKREQFNAEKFCNQETPKGKNLLKSIQSFFGYLGQTSSCL